MRSLVLVNPRLAGANAAIAADSGLAGTRNMLKERVLLVSKRIPLRLKTSYDKAPGSKHGADGGKVRVGAIVVGS